MKQYLQKDIDVIIYIIGLVLIGYCGRSIIYGGSGYVIYSLVLLLMVSILIKVIDG